MDTYTIITGAGRKTTQTGTLAQVIASQSGRKTTVGIYCGGLHLCTILVGGEVVWAI